MSFLLCESAMGISNLPEKSEDRFQRGESNITESSDKTDDVGSGAASGCTDGQEKVTLVEEKKARRILANRASAQRSRQKKMEQRTTLEKNIHQLEVEVARVEPEVEQLKGKLSGLQAEQSQLQAMVMQLQKETAEKDKKNLELRQAIHQMEGDGTLAHKALATSAGISHTLGLHPAGEPPVQQICAQNATMPFGTLQGFPLVAPGSGVSPLHAMYHPGPNTGAVLDTSTSGLMKTDAFKDVAGSMFSDQLGAAGFSSASPPAFSAALNEAISLSLSGDLGDSLDLVAPLP